MFTLEDFPRHKLLKIHKWGSYHYLSRWQWSPVQTWRISPIRIKSELHQYRYWFCCQCWDLTCINTASQEKIFFKPTQQQGAWKNLPLTYSAGLASWPINEPGDRPGTTLDFLIGWEAGQWVMTCPLASWLVRKAVSHSLRSLQVQRRFFQKEKYPPLTDSSGWMFFIYWYLVLVSSGKKNIGTFT